MISYEIGWPKSKDGKTTDCPADTAIVTLFAILIKLGLSQAIEFVRLNSNICPNFLIDGCKIGMCSQKAHPAKCQAMYGIIAKNQKDLIKKVEDA